MMMMMMMMMMTMIHSPVVYHINEKKISCVATANETPK